MIRITGAQVKGQNHERAREDYYSTNPNAIEELLVREVISGNVLEPAVGNGVIARRIEKISNVKEVKGLDIRNDNIYGEGNVDFLNWKKDKDYDVIITNPPFSKFKEFALKSLDCLNEHGKVILFGRIQILEGKARYLELWNKYPPIRIYVFVKRQPCLFEGKEITSSLMAFAWFVWVKGYEGKPVIEWIY